MTVDPNREVKDNSKMKTRHNYTGKLCVHRESSWHEYLAATVTLLDGKEFYYYPVPKCFDDMITDGIRNVIDVTFTADEKGRNPRNVVAISEAR